LTWIVKIKLRRLRNILTICLRGYNTPSKMGNWILARIGRFLRLARLKSLPYQFTVDPAVGICNLKCPMCVTGLDFFVRRPELMNFDDFQKFVGKVEHYAYRINFYNWGEPFLNPHIFDMIRYAHEHRIFVQASSNMISFDQDMAQQAVLSGLDSLLVPLDGSTQETYEVFRRGSELAAVIEQTRLLEAVKKRLGSPYPVVTMRMIISRFNEHQVDDARRIACDLGVHFETVSIILLNPDDPAQAKTWLPQDEAKSHYNYTRLENVHPCDELWISMTIYPGGGVSPCCWPCPQQLDFGNLRDHPLANIWNNDTYLISRRLFSRWRVRQAPEMTICVPCQGRPVFPIRHFS
jgi:MoaA/NifB/PqqE/SkfB family radical SAM enzyme